MSLKTFTPAQRLAQTISVLLHPFLIIPITLGLLLWKVNLNFNTALLWALILLGFVLGPVTIALAVGRISGKYKDWDVHDRNLRFSLYRLGAVCLGLLLVLVHLFNAPALFRATVVAGTVALIAAWRINQKTKISLHTLIISAAGTAIILSEFPVIIQGITFGLIILLAISRVVAGAHTVAQVLLGFLIGVITVGGAYLIYV